MRPCLFSDNSYRCGEHHRRSDKEGIPYPRKSCVLCDQYKYCHGINLKVDARVAGKHTPNIVYGVSWGVTTLSAVRYRRPGVNTAKTPEPDNTGQWRRRAHSSEGSHRDISSWQTHEVTGYVYTLCALVCTEDCTPWLDPCCTGWPQALPYLGKDQVLHKTSIVDQLYFTLMALVLTNHMV